MATAPKAANKNLKAVPADGSADAPANSKKVILIVVGAVLLTLAAAGGAWFFLGAKNDAKHGNAQTAHRPVDNGPPVFMTMETFTVNLHTEDVPQFLQVNMTVQVAEQAT